MVGRDGIEPSTSGLKVRFEINKFMNIISVTGLRPLGIKVPQVVRYIDKAWVQHFFETGELLLTTFQNCRVHEDASRRDNDEGVARFSLENNISSMSGNIRTGGNSYMLCGSLVESTELLTKFDTDAYFMINDPIQFADTIARWLPGFTEGHLGPCIYRPERRINRKVDSQLLPEPPFPIDRPEVEPSQAELNDAMNKLRAEVGKNIHQALVFDPLFCKDLSFASEAEFRFVWTIADEVNDKLVIKCPAAIQFCSTHIPIKKPYQATRPKDGSGFFVATSTPPCEEQS